MCSRTYTYQSISLNTVFDYNVIQFVSYLKCWLLVSSGLRGTTELTVVNVFADCTVAFLQTKKMLGGSTEARESPHPSPPRREGEGAVGVKMVPNMHGTGEVPKQVSKSNAFPCWVPHYPRSREKDRHCCASFVAMGLAKPAPSE